MGHSNSKTAEPLPILYRKVPPVLIATYEKSWTKIILLLSEPNQPPIYAVNLPQGWTGKMNVHEGPSIEDPVLARIKRIGMTQLNFQLTLPSFSSSVSGSGFKSESGLEVGVESTVVLNYHVGRKERFCFEALVQNPHPHTESFEWRRSRGPEVKSVGLSRWGWKLVRIAGASTDNTKGDEEYWSEYSDDDTIENKPIATNAGREEVVAVWANSNKMSLSKVGEFRLVGRGATGEMGAVWELTAALTCFCVLQMEMQNRATSTVVAVAAS